MKKRAYTLIITTFLFFGLADSVFAQATKYAQAGMGFLKIDVGAQVAGMGGTYAGTIGSAASMFGNPAGLALLEGAEVSASLVDWIADIKLYGFGGAYNLEGIGTIGINVVTMDYGTFRRTIPYTGTDPDLINQGYVDLGTFTISEFAVGVSYARQITSSFYIGANIRYAKQDLGDVDIIDAFTGNTISVGNNVNNFVFDFGTLYYPGFKDLRFGVSVRNFSNQNDYFDQRFELPLTFDFGASMDMLTLMSEPPENSALVLAVDWLHPRDYDERLHVGAEYGFMDMFFLRGGYKFNYDEESFTAGLGVKAATSGGYGIRADYAYSAFGEFFGQVHRISVGLILK